MEDMCGVSVWCVSLVQLMALGNKELLDCPSFQANGILVLPYEKGQNILHL